MSSDEDRNAILTGSGGTTVEISIGIAQLVRNHAPVRHSRFVGIAMSIMIEVVVNGDIDRVRAAQREQHARLERFDRKHTSTFG